MTDLAQATHARIGADRPGPAARFAADGFCRAGPQLPGRCAAAGRRHEFFVDKLPFNFRYCGLIHQALPNAKIVHLTRDPLDTCYAIFKTLFINAYHYSYQLDEIAQFYIEYRRTMDHWHAVMPGVICDVSYEELVADPPAQCRRLLE